MPVSNRKRHLAEARAAKAAKSKEPRASDDDGAPLEQHVGRCLDRGQRAEAEGLLDLEASYARRAAPGAPFVVEASTFPWLVGEELPDFGPSTRPAFGVGCFGALYLTRGVIRQPARSSRAA